MISEISIWKLITLILIIVIIFIQMNYRKDIESFNEVMCNNILLNGSLTQYNLSYVNSSLTTNPLSVLNLTCEPCNCD